ncbi:MAG: permease-like cell division protein FtsX [Candidatus Pacebacteria bacterium]|jgi:cell division transport system permease protein|nr:permease-like cell division protein FtsX [Candidatus Paceibacterota bacterium]
MFNSLKRIIGLGWQNLARDGGIAVANVFIVMIPILLTSALFVAKDVSDFLIDDLQAKADISIYFNDSVSQDDILKVQDNVRGIPGVTGVEYVSKDEALAAFTKRHENEPVLLESLQEINENPFLPSLNVNAETTAQYEQVAALLAGDDYRDMVNKVNYSEKKTVIENIFALTAGAQKVGLSLFILLGLVSVMVTFNTVSMAIRGRGIEVGIQRLVGASRWFIRGQFLVQGVIFGILGALFSLFVTLAVCWYLNPFLATILPGMDVWQNVMRNLWPLFGVQLAIGAGLGMFSSLIAIGRHLKV